MFPFVHLSLSYRYILSFHQMSCVLEAHQGVDHTSGGNNPGQKTETLGEKSNCAAFFPTKFIKHCNTSRKHH